MLTISAHAFLKIRKLKSDYSLQKLLPRNKQKVTLPARKLRRMDQKKKW